MTSKRSLTAPSKTSLALGARYGIASLLLAGTIVRNRVSRPPHRHFQARDDERRRAAADQQCHHGHRSVAHDRQLVING